MNVSSLAKKLNAKVEQIIVKLKLLGLEVSASSKLDELTVIKATLMLLDNPRVDDIAKVLHLSTEKVINKLSSMGIAAISHLSIIKQKDLVRFLSLDNLFSINENALNEEISKSEQEQGQETKTQVKHRRLYQVARDLGVNKKVIINILNDMHIFSAHHRTPLDEKTIWEVKERLANVKTTKSAFNSALQNLFDPILNLSRTILASTRFFAAVIYICILFLLLFSSYVYYTSLRNPGWKVSGLKMSIYQETTTLSKGIGILEIHESDKKLPIAEEGDQISELTPSLIYLKNTPLPGFQGITVLTDPAGSTYSAFNKLKAGDILIVKIANNETNKTNYYKVSAENDLLNIAELPLKSGLLIKIKGQSQPFEIKAVLQKTE